MAKIEWKYPIEAMHGKLKGTFGAAKRSMPNAKGVTYNYSVNYGKRTTEVGTTEQNARDKFAAIVALVSQHRSTASKRVQDATGFKAQTTYPTFRQYLWHVCKTEYLASLAED